MRYLFLLTDQCSAEFLRQATEIKTANPNRILEFVENYPDATIVLKTDDITAEKANYYNILTKKRFILALSAVPNEEIRKLGVRWYLDYPISTYEEFQELKKYGAESALIAGALFNDLAYISTELKTRLVPNVAYFAHLPKENGIVGSWVRPEDIALLTKFNIIFEFKDCEKRPKKEEGLFRIYNEEQCWNGDLNNLITNLNYSTENINIVPDLIKYRVSCQQQCCSGAHCRLCYRYLQLANKESAEALKQMLKKE